MIILVVCCTAFVTAILTFFSGFGLGTILAPVMMLFFPVELAIALTGVVHLVNNLFKFLLVRRDANWRVVRRFGIPAIFAAIAGAGSLLYLNQLPVILTHELCGRPCQVTILKLIISVLLIAFSLMDVIPGLKNLQFDDRKIALGGLLSGFFGGLSGHQGALRSAFLIRCGLSKESFIATGVVIAVAVDLTRLGVYFGQTHWNILQEYAGLLVAASLSAIAGALIGNLLIKKVTLQFLQIFVTVSVVLIALAVGIGLI